jgi:hypothetical protein
MAGRKEQNQRARVSVDSLRACEGLPINQVVAKDRIEFHRRRVSERRTIMTRKLCGLLLAFCRAGTKLALAQPGEKQISNVRGSL